SVLHLTETPTTNIYTLSLHDALPISQRRHSRGAGKSRALPFAQRTGRSREHLPRYSPRRSRKSAGYRHALARVDRPLRKRLRRRSEEHTSELQSRVDLVCRLLLEKKT